MRMDNKRKNKVERELYKNILPVRLDFITIPQN